MLYSQVSLTAARAGLEHVQADAWLLEAASQRSMNRLAPPLAFWPFSEMHIPSCLRKSAHIPLPRLTEQDVHKMRRQTRTL